MPENSNKPLTTLSTGLELTLDGTVPGLEEHALSVGAFGPALARMRMALQRIASGLQKDADVAYGAKGGRYTVVGSTIDLEIVRVEGNSPLKIAFRIVERTPPGQTLPLFDRLTDVTTDRFLEAVEKESDGIPFNKVVRYFIQKLPPGLGSQAWDATTGKKVRVGVAHPPQQPRDLPHLYETAGTVVGLSFEPWHPEVRIKIGPYVIAFAAPAALVERAVEFRGGQVRILAIRGHKSRLLAIGGPDVSYTNPSIDAEKYIFARWDALLRRLAE